METKIPWAKPNFWGNEIKYVNNALESKWISGGPYIEKLEENFSQIMNIKYALTTSSGTASIHLAYLSLGLNSGDEIILPGFGFLAVANIAFQMKINPVFAEVNPDTWCITADEIEKKITSKTKAIVVIHNYGNVCPNE